MNGVGRSWGKSMFELERGRWNGGRIKGGGRSKWE